MPFLLPDIHLRGQAFSGPSLLLVMCSKKGWDVCVSGVEYICELE